MSEVRIGDAERELAQTTLNDHYAAGRLDHDEYTERLDRIWAARTRAELDPVFSDLPGPSAQRAPRSSYPYSTAATRRPSSAARARGPRMPAPLLVLLVVVGAIVVTTNLPLILVGLGVWFFFFRGGSCRSQSRRVMRG